MMSVVLFYVEVVKRVVNDDGEVQLEIKGGVGGGDSVVGFVGGRIQI